MKLRIFIQNYFPFQFIILGTGLVVGSFLAFSTNIPLSFGMFLVGILLVTTHQAVIIDPNLKFFKKHIWILGLIKGSKVFFDKIEYLYITSGQFSQQYGPIYPRFSAAGKIYYGFIKFSEENKILLCQKSDKKNLISKMNKYAEKLGVKIKDLTDTPQ